MRETKGRADGGEVQRMISEKIGAWDASHQAYPGPMASLIRMDRTGHTTLAEWSAEDDAAFEAAVREFADQQALGYIGTVPNGPGKGDPCARASSRREHGDPAPADRRRLVEAGQALPELAAVPWRQPTDARWLRRWGRIWHAWTLLYTVPFIAAAAGMMWLEPLAAPVALAALAHAWIIPELYAFRGASVVRPKARGAEPGEEVAQGLLGDLLGHAERDLQRDTGLALERGSLGVWLVGRAGRSS